MKCKNCARYVCVNDDNERILGKPNWCFYLSDSPCPDLERDCKAFIPLRNADRIRAMTDEELANWLEQFASCELCPAIRERCGYGDGCVKAWLDWLKEEVTANDS